MLDSVTTVISQFSIALMFVVAYLVCTIIIVSMIICKKSCSVPIYHA